jgi:hypothetical protein
MIRAASTRRHRFLPYRFDELGLTLTPLRCILDGRRDVGASFDSDRHVVDLSEYRFESARIELSIGVPANVLGTVLPSQEQSAPPVQLFVLVSCEATRLRRHVAIAGPPLAQGHHRGEVDLVHADLVGSVELTPMIVRARELSSGEPEFGAARGTRLASGRPVEVRIETLRDPGGAYLDVRYDSFRSKGPPQFPRIDALYKLECGEHPILWLNSDHVQVCSVLDDVANVGRMARLREVMFDRIEYAVWARLFLRAARSLTQEGESIYPWHEAVLHKVLPLVYPEVLDHESRLAAVQRDLAEGNEDDLLERLDGGLQEHMELGAKATKLAEELA